MKKLLLNLKKYGSAYFTILLALLSFTCCNKKNYESKSKNKEYVRYPYTEIPKDSSIILWKKPGIDGANFELWKKNHGLTGGKKICPFCTDNSELELYEGVSIEVFGGKAGVPPCTTTQVPPCKPTGGGDDTVYYCYNVPINLITPFFEGEKFYDTSDQRIKNYRSHTNLPDPVNFNIPSEDAITGETVNIGIFDTGIDPAITVKYTQALPGACNVTAAKGWNFANNNADTKDDYPGMHGTTVSKFIIDQVINYHKQKVNIIPVKIFDNAGHTSLYNILCGFIYAQKSGIQIVNASFGFYWHDFDNPPGLFNDFVKTYLTNNKIILVAAAGNRDIEEDNLVQTMGVSSANFRNLEKHPCYPAALAGQPGFENVFAVTTLLTSEDRVSPQQNFSSKIVDIGVNGDAQYLLSLPAPTEEFGFKDPLNRPAGSGIHFISGSSYATPIVTGKIASFYNQVVGTGSVIKKVNLILKLQSQNLIKTSTGTGIKSQIRKGMYADKN